MAQHTADLAVVGGGPAGTAAAITAARLGQRVVLFDKAVFPRDKCCGDGLTTGALRHLHHLGLQPAAVASWQQVAAARVRSAPGRIAEFRLPAHGIFAASARRSDLDAALVRLACDAGVDVREGCAVTGLEAPHPARRPVGPVVVATAAGETAADYVIAADGAWSPTRKALGSGADASYRGDWHALRQYFSGVSHDPSELWVWFEPDLLPGYAWSFPLPGGRANVGFGVHRRPGAPVGNMLPRWDDICSRPHIREVLGPAARPEQPARTWPIPASISRRTLAGAGGRVLFVGDAARASDPMTGEGIAQALETGILAARIAAAAGRSRPAAAAAAYRRAVGRSLAVDDRISRAFSAVLRRPTDRWLSVATASGGARRAFARWMFEDVPRGVVLTPWRWRPGALHQPAPYPA